MTKKVYEGNIFAKCGSCCHIMMGPILIHTDTSTVCTFCHVFLYGFDQYRSNNTGRGQHLCAVAALRNKKYGFNDRDATTVDSLFSHEISHLMAQHGERCLAASSSMPKHKQELRTYSW